MVVPSVITQCKQKKKKKNSTLLHKTFAATCNAAIKVLGKIEVFDNYLSRGFIHFSGIHNQSEICTFLICTHDFFFFYKLYTLRKYNLGYISSIIGFQYKKIIHYLYKNDKKYHINNFQYGLNSVCIADSKTEFWLVLDELLSTCLFIMLYLIRLKLICHGGSLYTLVH